MKETCKLFCLCLVVGFLFSCRPHQYPHILLEADSLCEVCPDSAVVLLRQLRPQFSIGSEADRMYYKLLCIKADNKNYHIFTSDSDIVSLVHYYEKHRQGKLLAEAYYLAGQISWDLHDGQQAIDYYQRSAEIFTKETDSSTKIMVYYQMADLYLYQRLENEAIASYYQSLAYCNEANDTIRMLYVLRDLAFALEDNDRFDESIKTYNQALELSRLVHNEEMEHGIKTLIASFYNHRGQHQKALSLIQDEIGYDEKRDRSSHYSIIANIYDSCNMEDSALFYYKKMYVEGEIYAKRKASQQLAKKALNDKNMEMAYDYIKMYDILSDSIRKMDAAKAVAEMSAVYNYELREKENARLTIKNKNMTSTILVILLASVLTISTLAILWLNDRRKKHLFEIGLEKLNRIKEMEIAKSTKQINANKNRIEELRRQLASIDQENSKLSKQLKEKEDKLVHIVALAEIEKNQNEEANRIMQTKEIIITARKCGNEGLPFSNSQWEKLTEEMELLFPNLKTKLNSLFTPSEHEYHIVLLMKAKLTMTQIASLTTRSKQAISSAKARMYQKAFKKKGKAEDWDIIVEQL